MKLYGLLLKHTLSMGGVWSNNLEFTKEVGKPNAAVAVKVNFDSAPASYSGRDMFSFADIREDYGWLDVYRNTATTKLSPSKHFQENAVSCIAHKLCSLGKDPIAILIGDTPEAFANVKDIQVISVDDFGKLMASYYPTITLKQDGSTFTATTDSASDIYWETTGGILSNTRTKSGQPVTLANAGTGAEVRVGWKYFSNVAKVVL